MGGTTAKLCVIERGVPRIGDDLEVGRVYRLKPGSGLPVRVPSVDMVEVGAGGGSIARVNSLGLVNVGPDSAGADPGPACYGQGGSQPTVTDADLVLGYLDPRYFLGGRMRLDRDAAFAVLEEHVASKLGVSVEEAAAGIHLLVNEGMANAARAHVLERGVDPHVLPLFAFGGAGPVHAVGVAASLGSPAVIVPYGAGVLSALGFLAAPVAFDLVRSCRIDLGTARWSDVDELVRELEDEGGGLLAESGVPSADVSFTRIAEMRYIGQGQAVRVGLPEGELPDWQSRLLGDFEGAYRTLYGHGGPSSVPVEIVRVRVTASGPAPRIHIEPTKRRMTTPASAGERDAYFSSCGGFVRTPVWERAALKPGAALPGPAVVQEPESTLVVPPDYEAVVTDELALRVSKTAV
jgi:N-methylhydantoinase A